MEADSLLPVRNRLGLLVVGAGQGKGLYGAVGIVVADSADQGTHRSTGGEDVVDEEEGSERGEGGRGGGDLVNVLELGPALVAGQVFAREGRPGFGKEGGEVAAVEAGGKGIAEEVEGGGNSMPGELSHHGGAHGE